MNNHAEIRQSSSTVIVNNSCYCQLLMCYCIIHCHCELRCCQSNRKEL